MTVLDELTHEDRLQLARDLRAAEAKERECERQRKAREQEAHRLNMRIESLERRRGRLADELAKRDAECEPFEATLNEAEPDRDDRFAWERWTHAVANARENLDVHDRRRGYLRKIITGIGDELRAKLDE